MIPTLDEPGVGHVREKVRFGSVSRLPIAALGEESVRAVIAFGCLSRAGASEPVEQPPPTAPEPHIDLRRAVWEFIAVAPTLPQGGDRVGEATSAVTPWPYQVRAFHRMYDNWPPRLLIADEVGLGKTIEAGLLLRQAWLARKAVRILILAPKNVCAQSGVSSTPGRPPPSGGGNLQPANRATARIRGKCQRRHSCRAVPRHFPCSAKAQSDPPAGTLFSRSSPMKIE